ncbi:Major facilitator superfamily [Trinorchestia longiramus]|nr:Major facilitator superfamily [Trinorchestia longiramus]
MYAYILTSLSAQRGSHALHIPTLDEMTRPLLTARARTTSLEALSRATDTTRQQCTKVSLHLLKSFSCCSGLYQESNAESVVHHDLIKSNCDCVGPPDPVSRLRRVHYHIPKKETSLQASCRAALMNTQDWNQKYWFQHNTSFEKEKQAFITRKLTEKQSRLPKARGKDDPAKQLTLTSEEMAEFYKHFLDANYDRHMQYNREWYKKNFENIKLEAKVCPSRPPAYAGKLTALGWLYLVQGIPYGLQDKFVPLQLRARGLDYSSVSAVKAVLVPWVTKGLWAPALQLYGDKRRWLLAALLLLAAASFAGSWCDVSEGLPQVVAVLLLLNVGCALQDVVVDGLALLWLPHSQLGLVNSIQVVLYKVGSLCGGGGLMFLLSVSSWRTCLLLLTAVYTTTALWVMILPLQSKHRERTALLHHEDNCETEEDVHGSNERHSSFNATEPANIMENDAKGHAFDRNKILSSNTCRRAESCVSNNRSSADSISSILRAVFCADGSKWLALYVMLYKMAERGAYNNFPLFLLDKGLSMEELSFWNGFMSQILSIAGSVYGGVVCSRSSSNCSLLLLSHSIQRVLLTVLQSYCVYEGLTASYIEVVSLNYYVSLMSLCYFSFSTGVISTLTFTLMMRYSKRLPEELQSSHYSVFASIEVAGKLAFATVAGALVDFIGIQNAFVIFSILSAVPVVLLAFEPNYKSAKTTQ